MPNIQIAIIGTHRDFKCFLRHVAQETDIPIKHKSLTQSRFSIKGATFLAVTNMDQVYGRIFNGYILGREAYKIPEIQKITRYVEVIIRSV